VIGTLIPFDTIDHFVPFHCSNNARPGTSES